MTDATRKGKRNNSPRENTIELLRTVVAIGFHFHLRPEWNRNGQRALLLLALASIVVFICWFGVNYLPSATQSVHTYTS